MSSPDPFSAPPPRNLRLRVDTGISDENVGHLTLPLQINSAVSMSLNSPPASPALPPTSPIAQVLQSKSSVDQKRNEFRKVIELLIHNLNARKRPPSAFDEFRRSSGGKEVHGVASVLQAVRGAVKMGKREGLAEVARSMQTESTQDQDGDVLDDGTFSTDNTVEHLIQLRDVLIMSAQLGWNVLTPRAPSTPSFQTPSNSLEPPSPRSPFRRRRQSLRRSPSKEGRNLQDRDILDQIVFILTEIIAEDCRFKVKFVRLSKPPNSLQSVCLDVAQCLISSQHSDPKTVAEIAFAVLPAFTTFPAEMHPRLLAFFEDFLVRPALESLDTARNNKPPSKGPPLRGLGISSPDGPTGISLRRPSSVNTMDPPMVSIKVDEPQDDGLPGRPGWIQWSPSNTNTPSISASPNVLSTFAPSQLKRVYLHSALIPPLLVALLSSIQFPSPSTPINTVHRIHHLIQCIVTLKPDCYSDFLEIVAYHTDRVRWSALAIMTSIWPSALGHAFVGRAFPIVDYDVDALIRDTSRRHSKLLQDDSAYQHEFIPWCFSILEESKATSEPCHVCFRPVDDFGLLCVLCTCVVHVGCYEPPDYGNIMVTYPLPHDPSIQKFASIRYSYVLSHRRALKPPATIKQRHNFRLINLFTLTCCIACKEPLWETTKQAMECSGCSQFVHERCLSHSDLPYCGAPQSASFTITSSELRKSFRNHYRDIIFDSKEELMKRTYEDVSVCHGVLWTQLAILDGGVNSGSLYIMKDSNARWVGMDDVVSEIQKIVARYEAHMVALHSQKSDTLEEFERLGSGHGIPADEQAVMKPKSMLFDWSLVAYITALIKSPQNRTSDANGASVGTPFLSVNGEFGLGDSAEMEESAPVEASHPFEIVVLSHMRDVLGFEFNVFSDAAARYLLSHIHACHFFHRLDHQSHLFPSMGSASASSFDASQIDCAFPLPLIIDYSTSVETLVSAISACLGDLDITLNEVGFLWLMKRCWPSGLTSDYASHRLAGVVVAWIVSEDDRLLRIARDFVARGIPLPGVRASNEISEGGPWPNQNSQQNVGTGMLQSSSSRSGGEYLACRKQLLARYGSKWMEALWRQDEELYIVALYDHCTVLAREEDGDELMELLEGKSQDIDAEDVALQRKISKADQTLKHVVKLSQSSIVYSGFARILGAWLDSVAKFSAGDRVSSFPSLLRLFTKDDSARRSVIVTTPLLADSFAKSDGPPDPWNVIASVASEGSEGLVRSIAWLRVLSQSSVDIPIATFQEMSTLCKTHQVGFSTVVSLTEAIFCNVWVYTAGRSKLIGLIAELHSRYLGWITISFDHVDRVDLIHRFLRFTLSTALLLYGCNKDLVASMDMIGAAYVAGLSGARSRASMRASSIPVSMAVDTDLILAASKYVIYGTELASGLAIKFLSVLFTETSWLAEDATTSFLTSGDHLLHESVWKSFDLEDHSIRYPRMHFLLRLLNDNTSAFEETMTKIFDQETQWNIRFDAVNKLFRIILDLNNPVFALDNRRPCVLPIFRYFFRSIYEDSREEVRLSAETLAGTLLPAHFYSITHCWDDAFSGLNEEKRLHLINFLIQLLPHFPKWRVLSWGTIVHAMLEDEPTKLQVAQQDVAGIPNMTPVTPRNGALEDFEPSPQSIALVCLSLDMIANGIVADMHVLLRIKHRLAIVLGYAQAELVPNFNGTHFVRFGRIKEIPKSAHVCLRGLVRALDTVNHSVLLPSAMGVPGDVDSPSPNPVGAIFIDLALSLLGSVDFRRLPYLAARALLDALITIIYKYDITRRSLQHLQDSLAGAVEAVTQIVKMDISYDLRSAVFTAAHGFLRFSPNLVIKILGHQFFTIAYLLSDMKIANENMMVAQGTAFLETALVQFSKNGLFILLLKYPIMSGFFDVIAHVMQNHAKTQSPIDGQSLKDVILSDTITKLTERVDQNFSKILVSLQQFVEVVHFQNYPPRLMQDIASATTALARLAADPQSVAFDPNPWITMCTVIVQNNAPSSRDLIVAIDALLKAVLLRYEVKQEALEKLLQVVGSLYRRGDGNAQGPHQQVVGTVLTTLTDSLKGKNRATPATMTVMLKVMMNTLRSTTMVLPPDNWSKLGIESLNHLQSPPGTGVYSEENLTFLLVAGECVHEATARDAGFLFQNFLSTERPNKTVAPIRAWNTLALAALSSASPNPATNLLINLSGFSFSYTKSLLALATTSNILDAAALDVNRAVIAAKLWMMLCKKKEEALASSNEYDDDQPVIIDAREDLIDESAKWETAVWNELWPPFEAVLTETTTGREDEVTPYSLAIWTSLADLILFIHQLRSSIALEKSVVHGSILRDLLRRSKNESANNKFNRALKCVTEPPAEIALGSLIIQTRNELLASEKLASALESRRAAPERVEKRYYDRRGGNRTVG